MQAYFSSPNILHESRGLYYSYSGEVAPLLNTPIFSKFIKKLNQFYKKLRSDKVGSNQTLPKGQKPKWHLTTNCHTDKKWSDYHCMFGV